MLIKVSDTMTTVAASPEIVHNVCPSCGQPQPLKFCAHCGEKRVSRHDYSIAHFAGHVLENFTHFDFRSFRAVAMLVSAPGELTRSYLDGRRRNVIGPIQLFVIINVLFALSGLSSFRTPLSVQEHDPPFAAMKRAMVAKALEESNLTRQEFTREFNANAGTQGKSWVFAMIPALALCLAALYGFRRYLFEHLVFAAHFYAFMLLATMFMFLDVGWILRLAGVRWTAQAEDFWLSLALQILQGVYFYFALRRVYGDGKTSAVARAATLAVLVFPILLSYRFLLFFITLYTMH